MKCASQHSFKYNSSLNSDERALAYANLSKIYSDKSVKDLIMEGN